MNFNIFSPTDFRYSVEELKPYLSEQAFVNYKAKVEAALIKILCKRGIIKENIAKEIINTTQNISAAEVYKEEQKIKHDIRALCNVIKRKVSKEAKPYVHLTATSYDIVDTANILRYKDAANKVILPYMFELQKTWIEIANNEKSTLQIGRTHGQHAVPITFGFAIALYVERIGTRILNLKECLNNLTGKFSGACGTYNASSLFFNDADIFEKEILQDLGLKPASISTQIVLPEPLIDFLHSITSSFGVLANFSDDMRNLQRSEIAEIGEKFEKTQVGSSTMPHKRNPINFENIKSMWKEFMPRMITVYADGISEHQRDLTNSCSQRYIPELLVAFTSSLKRLNKACLKLQIDREKMKQNFELNKNTIIAEPLYILLAFYGYSNSYEHIKKLTLKAYQQNIPLINLVLKDKILKPYLEKFTHDQKNFVLNPTKYIGLAEKKVTTIISFWEKKLRIL